MILVTINSEKNGRFGGHKLFTKHNKKPPLKRAKIVVDKAVLDREKNRLRRREILQNSTESELYNEIAQSL